jgi:hypothetical protein
LHGLVGPEAAAGLAAAEAGNTNTLRGGERERGERETRGYEPFDMHAAIH